MERPELLELAGCVLRLPTAPYHEQQVKNFVTNFCRTLPGVRIVEDRVGNVIAKWERSFTPKAFGAGHRDRWGRAGRSRRSAPLVFVAHMDHPGFEFLGGRRAEFLGGVPKEMFQNARVRFHGITEVRRATVSRFDAAAWPKRKLVTVKFKRGTASPEPGTLGVWDVPAFRVSGGKLHAAAIDDVLAVAVGLAMLTDVSRRRLRTRVWCAFTRAEEVGFHGAMALIRSKKIPANALVVSIEMSKERPSARIGNGPIVRVGDRATIFDPAASGYLWRVAERCRKRESGFQAQRCLMDGGTCEATAFGAYGYRAGGLCLPLGNYHNVGKDLRPRAEYVSIRDLGQLVKLAVAAAEQWRDFEGTTAALRKRLSAIEREAPRTLRKI